MNPKNHHSNDNSRDAGLFTWDLETDALYADSALAELFGLDKSLAERGLPISDYLERVFEADRPALAGALRHAILTAEPLQESYRVHRGDDDLVRILAFGRCFRDDNDQPRLYAGIVFPMPEEKTGDDALLWQCSAALEIAKREGRADVAALLGEAIRKLNGIGSLAAVRRVG